MIVIGVDPGYEQSAFVVWNQAPETFTGIVIHGYEDNAALLDRLRTFPPDSRFGTSPILVIEQIESFGMAVGKTVFETVFQSGRFAEAWFPKRVERLPRRIIKLHLCGQSRATDSNIRQALIDRFGPTTQQAFGTKKAPGPLYGITSHKLAALAVAITWADQHAGDPLGEILRPGTVSQF